MTGNFDDWGKSVRLDRKGDAFEKTVELPFADEKVLYKVRSTCRCLRPVATQVPPAAPSACHA